MIKFAGEGVGWRRTDSYPERRYAFDLEVSDNIVIALCFDCRGRVLSEML